MFMSIRYKLKVRNKREAKMLGQRMRDLREELGLTQDDLAEKIGVNVLQINRYEHNKNKPSSDIVSKIAISLNTSADYLLGLTDEPAPVDLIRNGLSPKERAAVSAWRRGDYRGAIKEIVSDE